MMPLSLNKWKIAILVLLSLAAYYYLGYELDRTHFYELLLCFSLAFISYFIIVSRAKSKDLSFYLIIGVLFRILFLLSYPALSDDYFRFIWDGQMLANGLNPFDQLPANVEFDFPNKTSLLAEMNSPHYYSVYPPLAQMVYWLSVKISPNSILGSIVIIRTIILLTECGTLFLLPKLLKVLKMNPINSLWYVLNPLVIVELSGNLHFEGIVIFFLTLAFYFLYSKQEKLASVAWALAAATKLIPIFLLPILLRKLNFKKAILFYCLFAILFILLWLPFYNSTLLAHFMQSIQLYSSSFEFNASIYYVVREIGYLVVEYNIIKKVGPWLAAIAYSGILLILLKKKTIEWSSFFELMLFALSWYYLFALIVHPWYSISLLFLGVFTQFKYPVLWSFLALLSYWAYSNPSFHENYTLLAIEYVLVIGYAVWEGLNQKLFSKTNHLTNKF